MSLEELYRNSAT